MKLEKTSKLQRIYSVSFTTADIQSGVNQIAEETAPKVKLKGYRDGHVPVEIVKQKYLPRLIRDFISDKCQEMINQEIKAENLSLATNPVIDSTMDFQSISDIKIKVIMETSPKVPEMDYSKIEAEVPKLKMTPEDMDREITSLLESKAKLEEIIDKEHQIRSGDVVLIDFIGSIDGVPFQGGKGENYQLEIGSKTFIDTFEDQLIGLKADEEKTVKVRFPEKYQKEDLAGKEATFETKVRKIYSKSVPKFDDDFAKSIGLKDAEELKQKVTTEVANVMDSAFYDKIRRKLLEVVLSKNSFDLPETVVQREVEARIAKAEKQGLPVNKKETEDKVRSDLSIWYYVQDIMEKEDSKITDEEFASFVSRRAIRDNLGDPATIMQLILSNPSISKAIGEAFKEERVVKYIIERINRKEIEMGKKDFIEYLAKIEPETSKGWQIKRKGLLG